MIAENAIPIPNGVLNVVVAVVMRWMVAAVMVMAAVVIVVMMMGAGAADRSVPDVQYMRLSLQIICYRMLLECWTNRCRKSCF